MRRDGALSVWPLHVLITHGRNARPNAALGLFPHALARFLTKVLDVVFRHEDLDTVQELLGRAGFWPDDDVFLWEVNLQTEVVYCDPVL